MNSKTSIAHALSETEARINAELEELDQVLSVAATPLSGKATACVEEIIRDLRELLACARQSENREDLGRALLNLGTALADACPAEAIDLTREIDNLSPPSTDTEAVIAADIRRIAYACLGDPVRARQQEVIVSRLRDDIGTTIGDSSAQRVQGLFARLRAERSTPADRQYAVELSEPLDEWLASRTTISLKDLGTPFGQFTSNDLHFYRNATNLLDMLTVRLKKGLGKPDCYLLHADPGSGKSFFVRQFQAQLGTKLEDDVIFLECNLSAYQDMAQAGSDIVSDVLIALTHHQPVLLFIDEVDAKLGGESIFRRLIAPMNGDPFFFMQKPISFAKQNLIVFFALSAKPEDIGGAEKWPDFLSRIPPTHHIKLPEFGNPLCRIYRAVAMLQRGHFPVSHIEAAALMYIGLRPWSSVRELEHAVEAAKLRAASSPALELADIALSPQDIDDVNDLCGSDIYAGPTHLVEIS